jgi:hypothetical protein
MSLDNNKVKSLHDFLFIESNYSDITYVINGKPYKLHKSMMSQKSDLFKSLTEDNNHMTLVDTK